MVTITIRAIAVSTAMSKLFESVIADEITTASPADKYQFGFKFGHSTVLYTSILKRTMLLGQFKCAKS